MKCALLILVAALAAQGAGASPLSTVNAARLNDCRGPGALSPLAGNLKLDAAVRHIADGASLAAALGQSGYLAEHSSIIHVTGPTSEAEVAHLLAAHYCRTLADSSFKEAGVQHRGNEWWWLLAAPVALPVNDPRTVGRQILELVNQARAQGHRCGSKSFAPSAPLLLDPILTQAALDHARDMAKYDLFDHTGHDGSSPSERVVRAGHKNYLVVGENIAAGPMSPREVTQGWLASPAHCENIMDARFTVMGVAYAENLESASMVFWAQEFAAPRER